MKYHKHLLDDRMTSKIFCFKQNQEKIDDQTTHDHKNSLMFLGLCYFHVCDHRIQNKTFTLTFQFLKINIKCIMDIDMKYFSIHEND